MVMVKTMVSAQRTAENVMSKPEPLDMGLCSKAAPRMSTSDKPYQNGIALPKTLASGGAICA